MRFSERQGIIATKSIQKNSMDLDLRNSIWNVIQHEYVHLVQQSGALKMLYRDFWKVPYTSKETQVGITSIFKRFSKLSWNEVYDLLEALASLTTSNHFENLINAVLEREVSAYRMVSGVITEIIDDVEMSSVESALSDEKFPNVQTHLRRALELLSDRQSPDYRNSIKESISAVESLSKYIVGDGKATLGDALKKIEHNEPLHGGLRKGFLSLYGFTSDSNGIRHGLMDESNLNSEDAIFFLVACTAFVNYLKTKIPSRDESPS
jgi:hypothetical protein